MKRLTIVLLLAASMQAMSQQPDAALKQKLFGKTKVADIYEEAEKHLVAQEELYKTVAPNKAKAAERQRKQWARWNAYWSARQNPDGTPANVPKRLLQAAPLLSAPSQRTLSDPSSGQWSLVGPGYTDDGSVGRVSRIAFHPTLASTIYIGTPNSGIWRTQNNGLSWSPLSSYAPTLGVSGIVVSHADANTIYALTGDGDAYKGGDLYFDGGFQQEWGYTERSIGVLKSTDGGFSWLRTGAFGALTDDNLYFGYRLVQHPTNAQILLAATSHGIYRTTNGGGSWTRCTLSGSTSDSRVIFDIEFMPGNPSIVYASGAGTGFFRSTDAGAGFTRITGSDLSFLNNDVTRMEIAVSPANSQVVYLFAGPGFLKDDNNTDDRFVGMFRSSDGGLTFTRRANSPDLLGFDGFCCTFENQSRYDMALAVKPTNSNVVITGGLVMWKSTDGGFTYNEETDYFQDLNNSDYIHPDIHDIAYNPHNSGLLYAATDGGIWVSNDDAYSWVSLNNGLSITQFYKMEAMSEDGWPWGGTQDNGTQWFTGSGTTFNHFDGGDGYDVMTDIDFNDKFWVVNKSIWTDGPTDENITPPGTNEFFPNLAKSWSNEEVIYAGYKRTYVSSDQGSNWTELNYTVGGNTIRVPGNWALASCRSNNNRLYAAGINSANITAFQKGLWRITGLNSVLPNEYTYLGNKTGFPASYTKITSIGVRPNNSDQVWITIGGFDAGVKVFYSGDGGDNWSNVSGTLPNVPILSVEVGSGGSAMIGTDIGVFFRTSSMTDWSLYSNNLPRVPVTDLDLVTLPGGVNMLYASTFGRGIWKTIVDFSCEADLNVTESSIRGLQGYQASNSITATSVVEGGDGTKVQFKAGTAITLTPGFAVVSGSNLAAVLAPCNSGPLPETRAMPQPVVGANKNSITPLKRKMFTTSQSKRKKK